MNAPFASVAVDYHRAGLSPFPCGGEDGKRPMVKGWKKRRRIETVEKLVERFPTANVGIPTGIVTNLTVIDCDDRDLAGEMIRRCGDTPLMTATPRGGLHLFYKHNGEKTVTRLDGEKVDIRGAGGLVIAPPSIRPDSGKSYTHSLGDFRDLPHLPPINPGSLPLAANDRAHGGKRKVRPHGDEGKRNNMLFAHLRAIGNTAGSMDALAGAARDFNCNFTPPLPDGEVMRTVASVWTMVREGRCIPPGGGTFAHIPGHVLDLLNGEHDAISLLVHLQQFHGARNEPFALKPEACTETFKMSRDRIRTARGVLVRHGLLVPVHVGGRGKGDPSTFRLRRHPLSPQREGGGV